MTSTAHERSDLLSKLGLDAQNKASLGRVLGTGNIGQAKENSDGRMSATIRINPDELCWDPQILVMPHGGDIELELINDDLNTHCALLPSNGDRKFIWLVNHSARTGHPQPRRARLLLVQLAHRKRRGPRTDRGHRRAGRRSAGSPPRPPRPAAPVGRGAGNDR